MEKLTSLPRETDSAIGIIYFSFAMARVSRSIVQVNLYHSQTRVLCHPLRARYRIHILAPDGLSSQECGKAFYPRYPLWIGARFPGRQPQPLEQPDD